MQTHIWHWLPGIYFIVAMTMAALLTYCLSLLLSTTRSASCICKGPIPTPQCDAYSSNQHTACSAMEYLNSLFWHKSSKDWGGGYWNTANTMEASVNFMDWLCGPPHLNITSQCQDILSLVESTAAHYRSVPSGDVYYDDLSWWSLAFLRLLEYTVNEQNLDDAVHFADAVCFPICIFGSSDQLF